MAAAAAGGSKAVRVSESQRWGNHPPLGRVAQHPLLLEEGSHFRRSDVVISTASFTVSRLRP